MNTVPVTGTIPHYAHPADAGADLTSTDDVWLMPGQYRTVQTGTKVAIPEGHFGLVAGRSGLGLRYGIALVNGIGVIDAGYRGEIAVGLVNHNNVAFHVMPGDRIAQLIIVPFVTARFEAVDDLDDTARGTGGLGSTGLTVSTMVSAA